MQQGTKSSTQDLMQQPPQMMGPGMPAGHRQPMPIQMSQHQPAQRSPDLCMKTVGTFPLTESKPESLPNIRAQPDQLDNIGGIAAIPLERTKDWQQGITNELRNRLVQKLAHTFLPSPMLLNMQEVRMQNLVSYARKVEGDKFIAANSRQDYYHLLAEQIFNIQTEIEEKRRQRKRHQAGSQHSADGSNQ